MDNGGQTADQVVRMTLQGIEVAAKVSMKVGEETSKTLAATLYAILTDKKKVKGKTRLNSLLRSGKELKVYALRNEDLKTFCKEAIILSMTPAERENPQILGASRKKRIAAGCGLDVVDVNRLLKQFEGMQQIIKQVTGGRKPGIGGFMHGRGLRKRKKK